MEVNSNELTTGMSTKTKREIKQVTLTVAEIRHLAEFVGILEPRTVDKFSKDENDEEITLATCPESGVFDEDSGKCHHYNYIAHFTEYPEEGVYPLGKEVAEATDPGPENDTN